MEYSEEIKKLAETLKNSGLAASMRDALKKAESMLGKKEAKKEEPEVKEEPFERETDAAQTILGEVKEPEEKKVVEESSEAEEELKKEEVFTNNPTREIANEEKQEGLSNKKKVDYSKEKKVDLNEVFDVNK